MIAVLTLLGEEDCLVCEECGRAITSYVENGTVFLDIDETEHPTGIMCADRVLCGRCYENEREEAAISELDE